jgi:hypothetical protein
MADSRIFLLERESPAPKGLTMFTLTNDHPHLPLCVDCLRDGQQNAGSFVELLTRTPSDMENARPYNVRCDVHAAITDNHIAPILIFALDATTALTEKRQQMADIDAMAAYESDQWDIPKDNEPPF